MLRSVVILVCGYKSQLHQATTGIKHEILTELERSYNKIKDSSEYTHLLELLLSTSIQCTTVPCNQCICRVAGIVEAFVCLKL